MIYGYVRPASGNPVEAQREALSAVECTRVFVEAPSSLKERRPALKRCLKSLECGDTLVVLRLFTLAWSLDELVITLGELSERGVYFRSITDRIDTGCLEGRLLVECFELYAQFKRDLTSELTLKGLSVAQIAGRSGGPKRKTTSLQDTEMQSMWMSRQYSLSDIAEKYMVSNSSVVRRLRKGQGD